jgi:hypothetical protein
VYVCWPVCIFFQSAWAENPVSNDTPWEKFNLNVEYFISTVSSDFALGAGVGVKVDV